MPIIEDFPVKFNIDLCLLSRRHNKEKAPLFCSQMITSCKLLEMHDIIW